MTIDTKDLLNSILEGLEQLEYIKPDDIPGIALYMDQVTTFMDSRLKDAAMNPSEEKILTKTMINNYTKNNLLPAPEKKKYSKEHILLLIFIYYYKSILSIGDIQTLLAPISENYFQANGPLSLEDIYNEAIVMGEAELEALKTDIVKKFETSQKSFADAPEKDREYLRRFAFICALGFDVYQKKLLIERLIDEMRIQQEETQKKEAQKKEAQKKEAQKKETQKKEVQKKEEQKQKKSKDA